MKFTRFDIYICLAALIGAVAIGVAYLDSGQREILKQVQELRNGRPANAAPAPQAVKPNTPPPPPPMPAEVGIEGSAIRGSAGAKVVMVEFSDFQCPFCGRYTRDTLPQIQKQYVDTGKIRYVWRNFPLTSIHPQAEKAGEAGECARQQGKFWEMHDQLYAHQDQLDPTLLPTHAKTIGLDMSAFTTCLSGGKGSAKVATDAREGSEAGIQGTPYFAMGVPEAGGKIRVLDYVFQGAVPFAKFQEVLDKVLAAAK